MMHYNVNFICSILLIVADHGPVIHEAAIRQPRLIAPHIGGSAILDEQLYSLRRLLAYEGSLVTSRYTPPYIGASILIICPQLNDRAR